MVVSDSEDVTISLTVSKLMRVELRVEPSNFTAACTISVLFLTPTYEFHDVFDRSQFVEFHKIVTHWGRIGLVD